jgi:beta-galactosidase
MKKAELKNNNIVIDGTPFFVYSGEIHYFRIPKNLWKVHLEKAKQANLNTVSSYIPWCWHEYEEGKFDFEGKTHSQRDLLYFLKLCNDFGLKFIARVGPISNAELKNEGVPGWLLKKHPEISPLGKGVTNLPHISLYSYHNPIFKEYVKRWYSKLLPIIEENQYIKGGPIILVQLCNEIGMVHWLNKAVNYEKHTEELYREFLKTKYKNITSLNKAYGTRYKSFKNITQPKTNLIQTKFLQRYIDWMEFYSYYYALYYKFLYDIYKKHNIQLPVIANIPQFYDFDVRGRGVYSPMTTIMFSYFKQEVKDVIFGGAYQTRRTDYDNFHDIIITSEIVRMISHKENPVMCCELQTGIMRDKPKLYPHDVEQLIEFSVASGLNGINCYMFSGGENLESIAMFGKYHDWQAPVSIDGLTKKHYDSILQFGKILSNFNKTFAETKNVYDLTIGFYSPYYNTELLKGNIINELENKRNLLFFDGILRLISLAGYYYNFVDLQKISLDELKKIPYVLVFCLEFMDLGTQKKLYEYVCCGGKLIVYHRVPKKDLNFINQDFLMKKFGLKVEEIKDNLVFLDEQECFVHTDIECYKTNDFIKVFTTKTGRHCGIRKKIDKGEVLILGFGLHHIYDYQIKIVDKILKDFGVDKYLKFEPENYNVLRVVRTNRNSGFLFLSNPHEVEENLEKIRIGKISFPRNKSITLYPRKFYILPFNVDLAENVKLIYTTAEIVNFSIEQEKIKILVEGYKYHEICLKINFVPKQVLLDGKKTEFYFDSDELLITFKNNFYKQSEIIIT